MIKRIAIIFFLYTYFVFVPLCAADAVRAKIRQARESLEKKLGTIQLRQTLSRNAHCLLKNICEPGQKEYLTSLAKKLGVSIAVLAAVATASGVAAKVATTRQEEPLQLARQDQGPAQAIPSINDLALEFGIASIPQDDSPPSRFIHAIRNKVPKVVASLTDLVSQKFLQLGQAVVRLSQQMTQSMQEQQAYKNIGAMIDQALATYDDSILHKNLQFIYAVTTGLIDEVKARMCDQGLMPSTNAIAEALAQVSRRAQRDYAKQEIVTFIKNPQCE